MFVVDFTNYKWYILVVDSTHFTIFAVIFTMNLEFSQFSHTIIVKQLLPKLFLMHPFQRQNTNFLFFITNLYERRPNFSCITLFKELKNKFWKTFSKVENFFMVLKNTIDFEASYSYNDACNIWWKNFNRSEVGTFYRSNIVTIFFVPSDKKIKLLDTRVFINWSSIVILGQIIPSYATKKEKKFV